MSPLTEDEIETTGTIALSKYNKLMVVSPRATLFGYPWMDTLAHEYTHLVVSRGSRTTPCRCGCRRASRGSSRTRWRRAPAGRAVATEQALLAAGARRAG